MVQGVDLWLNTPRRGEEACGTSGMKASINGVLEAWSVLDGWFDEAAEDSGGWAIGNREPYSPDARRGPRRRHLLPARKQKSVPTYYEARDEDVPTKWMERVKQCLQSYVSANYNCQRMIDDYHRAMLYQPAHRAWESMARDAFATASPARRVAPAEWPNCGRKSVSWKPAPGPGRAAVLVLPEPPCPLKARIDPGRLYPPPDVRVEALVGKNWPASENWKKPKLVSHARCLGTTRNSIFIWTRILPSDHRPSRIFSVRVTPNHYTDPLNRPCNAPIKWMS